MNKRQQLIEEANAYKQQVYANNSMDVTRHERGTPNGGQNNFKDGFTFELWVSGQFSTKKRPASGDKPDNRRLIDGLRKSAGLFSIVECKVQGGDLSQMYAYYNAMGKWRSDAVVYYLRKPYQKESEKLKGFENPPLYPVILTVEDFISAVEKYALRRNKSNGSNRTVPLTDLDGNVMYDNEGHEIRVPSVKTHCVEPNKKPWADFLAGCCPYSPLHHYTIEELKGIKPVMLTQEDYEEIEFLWDVTTT